MAKLSNIKDAPNTKKNYISKSNFEDGIYGWNTYADAAGTSPVDGTGGSSSLVVARDAVTTILRGTASLAIGAVGNLQGEGISSDFEIDNIDQGRKINISFDYHTDGSSHANGDFKVFVYDITNANLLPVLNDDDGDIMLAPENGGFIGTFYPASDSVNYRLIIHVATTNTAIRNLNIDNIVVGPEEYAPGAIVTEWESFTPTFNNSPTATYTGFKWKREGSDLLVRGRVDYTATDGAAGTYQLNISSINPNITPTGDIHAGAAGGYNFASDSGFSLFRLSSNSTGIYVSANGGSSAILGSGISSGEDLYFNARVEITEWKASNLISTQEALFSTYNTKRGTTAGQSIPSSVYTPIDFENLFYESLSIYTSGVTYTAGTGTWATNPEFTIHKTGVYRLSAMFLYNTTTTWVTTDVALLTIYINGTPNTALARGTQFDSSATYMNLGGTATLKLNKGDTVQIRMYQDTGAALALYSGNNEFNYVNIEEIPDFSVFGVHGETEIRSITSTQYFVSSMSSGDWADVAADSNGIELTPGQWRLDGAVRATDSTGTWSAISIKWSSENGDNTASVPANIDASANMTQDTGNNEALSINQADTFSHWGPVKPIHVTVTATDTVFINASATFSVAGAANFIMYITATRIK